MLCFSSFLFRVLVGQVLVLVLVGRVLVLVLVLAGLVLVLVFVLVALILVLVLVLVGPVLVNITGQPSGDFLSHPPAVGCHYFPPGLQSSSQPKNVTVLRPVPSYTAW